jgi:hypothetical protein
MLLIYTVACRAPDSTLNGKYAPQLRRSSASAGVGPNSQFWLELVDAFTVLETDFRRFDKDNSGLITFSEITAGMPPTRPGSAPLPTHSPRPATALARASPSNRKQPDQFLTLPPHPHTPWPAPAGGHADRVRAGLFRAAAPLRPRSGGRCAGVLQRRRGSGLLGPAPLPGRLLCRAVFLVGTALFWALSGRPLCRADRARAKARARRCSVPLEGRCALQSTECGTLCTEYRATSTANSGALQARCALLRTPHPVCGPLFRALCVLGGESFGRCGRNPIVALDSYGRGRLMAMGALSTVTVLRCPGQFVGRRQCSATPLRAADAAAGGRRVGEGEGRDSPRSGRSVLAHRG